eukprot:CCRYP_000611-RA/>CCRYP_000611-RA protein AED:0.47 eAED:0.47 QI:0/0/0/1/0/0/2/0/74
MCWKPSQHFEPLSMAQRLTRLSQTSTGQQPSPFAVVDEETGQALAYKDLIKIDKHKEVWPKRYANELGRLTQGI